MNGMNGYVSSSEPPSAESHSPVLEEVLSNIPLGEKSRNPDKKSENSLLMSNFKVFSF